jgi:hypothetical protein
VAQYYFKKELEISCMGAIRGGKSARDEERGWDCSVAWFGDGGGSAREEAGAILLRALRERRKREEREISWRRRKGERIRWLWATLWDACRAEKQEDARVLSPGGSEVFSYLLLLFFHSEKSVVYTVCKI